MSSELCVIEHVSYVKPRASNLSWKWAVKYHFYGSTCGIGGGGGYFGGGVLKCMMTFQVVAFSI